MSDSQRAEFVAYISARSWYRASALWLCDDETLIVVARNISAAAR